MRIGQLLAVTLVAVSAAAQQASQPANESSHSATALTIYNEDFAVARITLDLDLHSGVNAISTNQVTTQLEPDSVILRDPAAARPTFRILEQNYDAAVVNQNWLLNKYEGKTINFYIGTYRPENGQPVDEMVEGKIIRAPQQDNPYNSGGPQQQPLVEVNGQMRFQLPGTPVFPASTDGLQLKPTLRWQIESDKAQKLAAEFAYITGGLNWEATYNVVAAGDANGAVATEEKADLVGWVTIDNRTGVDFPQARIKLMAGDVAKIETDQESRMRLKGAYAIQMSAAPMNYQVTQKAFDDFHLYDLNRTVALQNGETKQVQFIEANGVTVRRSYLFDASTLDNPNQYRNYGNQVIEDQNYGLANSAGAKVQVVEEIKNSETNHLGMPLPAGRVRFYRRDSDGQMEFVGENVINHTPTEASVKVVTGNAFDVQATRRQTDFFVDNGRRTLDEFFEIKLTNQKTEPVTVTVREHLYRGENWEIDEKSTDYTRADSHTIDFPVQVPAKGDATLTYKVRYKW